jgi:uncharacterized protein with HEPN domain
MTLEDRDAAYLWDMLQAAKEVAEMTTDVFVVEFTENIMLCRATERCLEIIGESAKRVSDSCKSTHHEIPWRDIIGQRNIIAHEYGQIDYELLYKTAVDDIPALIINLEVILSTIDQE